MKTWCVYHFIHVRTPYRYIPKLIIREVPDNERVEKELLEEAGYSYGEFNTLWANQYIEPVTRGKSESALIAAVRNAECEELTWEELNKKAAMPV